MAARRGVYVAPFEELSDPRRLARLANEAEEHGFDGFFSWDHVAYRPPVRALADPWVSLGAVACATERIALGALVTPLSRRRVQKVARETVTLDLLSGGRLIFGAGLGVEGNRELEPFGEVVDRRERARLLDEGLGRLVGFWDGEFEPRPLQRPRIPVWIAGRYPSRPPLRRAVRWDGYFPIDLEEPSQLEELVAELPAERADSFAVVVEHPAGSDPAPWYEAGATWCLTSFEERSSEDEVRAAIRAGP